MSEATLRPAQVSDLEDILGWVNSGVTKNIAKFDHPITKEEEYQFLKKITNSDTDKLYLISHEGTPVGQIGLHDIDWKARHARLAVMISPEHQRKGYARKAIEQVLDIGFENFGLRKIWLKVFEENDAARRLYTRCGFKEDGILRDHYLLRGSYHNMIIMSQLNYERETISRR